jgi:hypothetical protein
MIQAKIIADSICNDRRITTMVVTMPRYILAEFNTHRMFSRNSASSRAIPFRKMVEMVRNNPFIPIAWQKDHSGMQGSEYFGELETFTSSDPYNKMAPGVDADSQTRIGPGETLVVKDLLTNNWLYARNKVVDVAESLNNMGVLYHPDGDISKLTGDGRGLTKQMCNRLLEPFMWHTVLVTATEWENFWQLRCPQYVVHEGRDVKTYYRSRKDLLKSIAGFPTVHEKVYNRTEVEWWQQNEGQADIHMMATAEAMWDAYNESKPKELKAGEWHTPYGDEVPMDWKTQYDKDIEQRILQVATARCARVSYTVVGGENKAHDYQKDIDLLDRLAKSGHWSPFEHCAQAMDTEQYGLGQRFNFSNAQDEHGWCRNFRGWIQYRAMIDKS